MLVKLYKKTLKSWKANNLKIRKPIPRRVKRNNGGASASPVTPKLLRDITQKVIQAFRPKNVILFGSYAYGVPTTDSDLDLLIVMESRDCPAERIRKVSDLFDPRPLPMDYRRPHPWRACGTGLGASNPFL